MLETDTFENKSSTDVAAGSNADEANIVQKFLYGQMEIPFVHFFKQSFLNGMFKNLEDIERIKKNNPTYASYIDRWLTEALRLKLVTINPSGDISKHIELGDMLKFTKGVAGVNLLNTIVQKITEISAKNLNKDRPDSFSTINYFVCDNDNETRKEVKEAYANFFEAMKRISTNSTKNKNADDALYVGITSCVFNEEVLNEL